MCAQVSHKQRMELLNQNIDSIDFETFDEQDTLPLEQYLQNMDLSTNTTITNETRDDGGFNSSTEDILCLSDITRNRQRPILLCSTPKKNKMDQTLVELNNNSAEKGNACERKVFETSDVFSMEFKTYGCDFECTQPVLSLDNE